jgi:hypothetical protein
LYRLELLLAQLVVEVGKPPFWHKVAFQFPGRASVTECYYRSADVTRTWRTSWPGRDRGARLLLKSDDGKLHMRIDNGRRSPAGSSARWRTTYVDIYGPRPLVRSAGHFCTARFRTWASQLFPTWQEHHELLIWDCGNCESYIR